MMLVESTSPAVSPSHHALRARSPLPVNGAGVENATTLWDYARRFLPENELIPLEEAKALVLSERAQLWCGDDCAGVTEVTDDHRLHLMLAGGAMDGLLAMRPDVEAFARAMGCTAIYLGGRRGWRRVFKQFGYAFDGEDMVKTL